jgi:tRNA threonylcarbamoyl adenosine modification protein YeaZ
MIVAIDSASTDLSVAIAGDDGRLLAQDGWRSDRRGGHDLLPRLLALLAGSGHRLDEASAFAVGLGPGSFTGLRVGMSVTKGLALGLRRPLVGVPSLEAWLVAEPPAVAAMARAGAREAYLLVRGDVAPRIVDRDGLPAGADAAPLVAPGELAEAFGLLGAIAPTRAAASVAGLAAQRLAVDPAGDDLSRLEPIYLRPPRGLDQLSSSTVATWR